MTDTQFYNDMEQLANELMSDFGTPATLRKVVTGKPDAEGKATQTPDDTPGLGVRVTSKEMMDALELKGDLMFAAKFPADTDEGDLIIHAGVSFSILSTKRVNPEGTRLMISFHGVRQV